MDTKCACIAATLTVIAGCGGAPRVEGPTDRFGLTKQAQVYIVHKGARPFQVDSTGYRTARIMFGTGSVLGSVADSQRKYESASIEQRLELSDPVGYGKERLATGLRRYLGLKEVHVLPEAWDGNLETFKEKHSVGALILLETAYWGVDDFRAKYLAKARVFNLDTGRRSRRAIVCPWAYVNLIDPKKSSLETSADIDAAMESLLANNGKLLKAGLRSAGEQCADQIVNKMVGLGSQTTTQDEPEAQDD